MSTTPKGPKPDEAGTRPPAPKPGESPVRPNMDQTFLGVAPPAAPKTPSGSAIIAAPMIAVSGNKTPARPASTPPTAPPPQPVARASAPPQPQPAQAGRSTQLGGGWQTSNVPPRGASPDRTLMHTSPQASPVNPAARDRRPSEPAPAAATRTPFPRPEARDAPAQPGGHTPAPAPGRPPGDAASNHTALASDYLRAARDAALGQHTPQQQPARDYPPPEQRREPQPYQAHQHTPAPHQYQAPPPHQPAHYPPAAQRAEPPSSPAPVTVPPPTAPPEIAPPERPVAPAAAFSPAPAFAARDELEGPRSMGTQASVAPPLEGGYAPPARPSAPVVHQAPAPEPIRAAPRSIAGTMLEQPPSIPIKNAPTAPLSAFSNSPSSVPAPAQVTRFEAVPSIRAPLADQPPASFGVSVQMDQSVAWDARGGESTQPQKNKREGTTPKGGSQVRLIALAAVAVLAIGFAAFSDQLKGTRTSKTASRPRPAETSQPAATGTETGATDDTPTGQARLANRPSNETGEATQALAQSAPVIPSAATPPTPTQPVAAVPPATAAPAAATAEADAPVTAEGTDAPVDDANASLESKMAAGAARHVIAGRYTEALPLYQQLEQSAPQNTAYAAMVRLLKQKTGATTSPATAP
jgi:hypothetical protein